MVHRRRRPKSAAHAALLGTQLRAPLPAPGSDELWTFLRREKDLTGFPSMFCSLDQQTSPTCFRACRKGWAGGPGSRNLKASPPHPLPPVVPRGCHSATPCRCSIPQGTRIPGATSLDAFEDPSAAREPKWLRRGPGFRAPAQPVLDRIGFLHKSAAG